MFGPSGHNLTVDIYSLGVVLYELLTGLPPHYSKNQEEMINNIIDSKQTVSLPKNISMSAKFLISNLLIKNPDRRLGARKGMEEIKEHPWIEDCDWDAYFTKKIKPPFIPNIYINPTSSKWAHNIVKLINDKPSGILASQRSRGLHTEHDTFPDSTTGSRICTIETPRKIIENDIDDLTVPEEDIEKSEINRHLLPFTPITKKSPGDKILISPTGHSTGKISTSTYQSRIHMPQIYASISSVHPNNINCVALASPRKTSTMPNSGILKNVGSGRNNGAISEFYKTVSGDAKNPFPTSATSMNASKFQYSKSSSGQGNIIIKGRKSDGLNCQTTKARKQSAFYN